MSVTSHSLLLSWVETAVEAVERYWDRFPIWSFICVKPPQLFVWSPFLATSKAKYIPHLVFSTSCCSFGKKTKATIVVTAIPKAKIAAKTVRHLS